MASTARNFVGSPWRSFPAAHARPLRKLPITPLRTATRLPELSREGLQWRTSGANVDIVVEVSNRRSAPTSPGILVIEAAPLGAFVPGHEIARVPVLAVDPGGRRRVPVSVARALLPTTRGPVEWPEGMPFSWDLELLLSADWVGNLNVWFDAAPERAVEAHRALDLKIAAGRRAAMDVYLPRAEMGFDFAITGTDAGWTAEVVHFGGGVAKFVVGAPVARSRTAITLLVTRRSDGYAVPVEFTFESVEGRGGHLGCISV